MTRVFYVQDLLKDVLKDPGEKKRLLARICRNEKAGDSLDHLVSMEPGELAIQLIEGVVMNKDTLTKFLSKDYYALPPLHNFFFTRDSAFVVGGQVFIGKMAGPIRRRETLIMETIYSRHPPVPGRNPVRGKRNRKRRQRHCAGRRRHPGGQGRHPAHRHRRAHDPPGRGRHHRAAQPQKK